MVRPSRRVKQFLPRPTAEAGTDNGADGIDWETSSFVPSTLTVEESDASPSVTPVTTIKLDAADFTLVDNADGSVSVTTDEPDAATHIADTTDAHDASAVSYDNTTSGLTATEVQAAIDEVAGGGGGGGITVQDEGTPLTTAATTLDFVGAGVTATGAGATKTITIPGGGGGGGAWVLLEQHTASSSADLQFTAFVNSSLYDDYIFEVTNVVPATNAVDFWVRTSTNGGSSYDAGASDYNSAIGAAASSGAATTGGTTTKIMIRNTSEIVNTASRGGVSGRLTLFAPHTTTIEKRVVGEFSYFTATTSVVIKMAGQRLSTADVDAVQFLFSSGNIASGTIRCYGLLK